MAIRNLHPACSFAVPWRLFRAHDTNEQSPNFASRFKRFARFNYSRLENAAAWLALRISREHFSSSSWVGGGAAAAEAKNEVVRIPRQFEEFNLPNDVDFTPRAREKRHDAIHYMLRFLRGKELPIDILSVRHCIRCTLASSREKRN